MHCSQIGIKMFKSLNKGTVWAIHAYADRWLCVLIQGILQGIYFGLGGGLGAILGGVLIDGYGAVPSFRLGAITSVAVLIVSGLIQFCIFKQKEAMKKEEKHAVELIME